MKRKGVEEAYEYEYEQTNNSAIVVRTLSLDGTSETKRNLSLTY